MRIAPINTNRMGSSVNADNKNLNIKNRAQNLTFGTYIEPEALGIIRTWLKNSEFNFVKRNTQRLIANLEALLEDGHPDDKISLKLNTYVDIEPDYTPTLTVKSSKHGDISGDFDQCFIGSEENAGANSLKLEAFIDNLTPETIEKCRRGLIQQADDNSTLNLQRQQVAEEKARQAAQREAEKATLLGNLDAAIARVNAAKDSILSGLDTFSGKKP